MSEDYDPRQPFNKPSPARIQHAKILTHLGQIARHPSPEFLRRSGIGMGSLLAYRSSCPTTTSESTTSRRHNPMFPQDTSFSPPKAKAGDPSVHERRAPQQVEHIRFQNRHSINIMGTHPPDLRTERATGAAYRSPFKSLKKYGQSELTK